MSDRKLEEVLNKLSPEAKEKVLANPDALLFEINSRNIRWPTKNAIPNIGQERALSCYMAPHPTYEDKYPFIMIDRGGNGTGKTAVMCFLIAGCTLGPFFMNSDYFNHQYFKDCEELRRKRSFKMRIVCDKSDMQENGSVHTLIKYWIPCADFKGKTSGGYFTEIRIPAPTLDFKETVIDIKTFDMDVEAHSGSEYDLIVFNEPPPQDLYTENISRLRRGGRAALFLTPLNQAAYLRKIENGDYPEGELFVTKTSIWDNCADIPGNRGILSKGHIERTIRQWYEKDPIEVPARRDGEYITLAGAIFQIFNETVHVVPPRKIEDNWNIYKIIDPHDKKPPFCAWIAVTPMNKCFVIAEYPTENWETINTTYLTIKNFVIEFELIQNGKNPHFTYLSPGISINECLGDPNKFKDRQPNTGKTMKEEYEFAGCETIFTKLNDDVNYGHERIRQLLLYDPERKMDSMNQPQLGIFSSCKNVIRAFKNYEWAEKQGIGEGLSDKIDKKWACAIACLRYFAVHFDGYNPIKNKINYDHELAAIDGSRNFEYNSDESVNFSERCVFW